MTKTNVIMVISCCALDITSTTGSRNALDSMAFQCSIKTEDINGSESLDLLRGDTVLAPLKRSEPPLRLLQVNL